MTNIYGVDTDKPYSPDDVGKALLRCFIEAHKEVQKTELEEVVKGFPENDARKLTEASIGSIVRNAFRESGGSYDKPTKSTLIQAMNYLKNYSLNYREIQIIQKNYNEMMKLVEKLPDDKKL